MKTFEKKITVGRLIEDLQEMVGEEACQLTDTIEDVFSLNVSGDPCCVRPKHCPLCE